MRGLLLRLSALDADAENAVRVIGFFDRLITERAGLDTLVRSTAELAGCPVGLYAPGQGLALRGDAGGAVTAGPVPARAVVRALEGGVEVWVARSGEPAPLDDMLLERFAIAAAVLLEHSSVPLPELGDPALVELVLSESVGTAERSRALHLLGIAATAKLRVLAGTGEVAGRSVLLGAVRAVLATESGDLGGRPGGSPAVAGLDSGGRRGESPATEVGDFGGRRGGSPAVAGLDSGGRRGESPATEVGDFGGRRGGSPAVAGLDSGGRRGESPATEVGDLAGRRGGVRAAVGSDSRGRRGDSAAGSDSGGRRGDSAATEVRDLAGRRGGALAPDVRDSDGGRLLRTAELPDFDGRLGVGPLVPAIDAAKSWQAARTALRYTSDGEPVIWWDRLGSLALLADRLGTAEIAALPDLRALDRLAAEPGMISALDALCATGSVRKAAAVLHRHHSTMTARLARAESMLGFEIDSASGRFRLHLALMLRRVRDNAG